MKTLFYIITICLLFLGCKKYPEDHKISLCTPLHRIISHPWVIDKITENGVDKSDKLIYNYDSSAVAHYKGVKQVFSKEKVYQSDYRIIKSDASGLVTILKWKFVNEENKIILIYGYTSYYINVVGAFEWEIVKLTKKDFVVKNYYNGVEYVIYFKNE